MSKYTIAEMYFDNDFAGHKILHVTWKDTMTDNTHETTYSMKEVENLFKADKYAQEKVTAAAEALEMLINKILEEKGL
jgi:hypothetical protein